MNLVFLDVSSDHSVSKSSCNPEHLGNVGVRGKLEEKEVLGEEGQAVVEVRYD